jgi:hypothetical protein
MRSFFSDPVETVAYRLDWDDCGPVQSQPLALALWHVVGNEQHKRNRRVSLRCWRVKELVGQQARSDEIIVLLVLFGQRAR